MAIGDLNPAIWRIDVYELKPDTPFAGVITDLSNLYTSDLTITKQRNYPDEIKFTLDLQQLEERAGNLNVRSRDLLEPYKHKVKCYRNNQQVCQGIVTKVTANLNNQSKNTLEVRCVDTLDLLEKRLIHQDYGEGSWADFAKEVIYDAQHEPNRIFNYAWEGDGTSIDNAWFRGWKYTPGENALRDFPEWEPNHLYSMYDTCTHDAKFWEAKEHAFYSGETFSESNWTLLGILDAETGDVAGVYGVWREDDEEPGPSGTNLGGWGGTSSCHMTAKTFSVNNAGSISGISMANSQISTSLVAPYFAKPRLPQEYQEVEYIESSGTQWINTRFVPTPQTVLQIKFTNLEVTGDAIIGTIDSTNDQEDYRFFNASSNYYFDIPGTGTTHGSRIYGGSCPANIMQEIEIGNFYIKRVNANSNIISGTTQTFTASGPLALNTYHANGGISKNRWYYVKIFESGELVHYLVPCYRKLDNVIGMYDVVGENFYINDGTGVFTKGEDKVYESRLPQEYLETQYLESTYGTTSAVQVCPYIDTGLNAREYGERLKMDMVVQFNSNTSFSTWHTLLGVSRGNYNGTWYWAPQYNFALNGDGNLILEYSDSSATTSSTIGSITGSALSTNMHHIILDSTPNKPTLSIDGTTYNGTVTRATGSKYGPSANIYIFARNYQTPEDADNHRRASYGAPMKLFYLKITDAHGNIVRDFVPCIRISDNTPGLYDMQHGKFYSNGNPSAGNLTAGPAVVYDNIVEDSSGITISRDTSQDLVRGNYQMLDGAIDTEKFAQRFEEVFPRYVENGYGPVMLKFDGGANPYEAGGYSAILYVDTFDGSGEWLEEYICNGETITNLALTMEAWGVNVNRRLR